ncbi:MAG TPA: hypothetical protein ENJ11_00805 [Gammaproteobacteria bacterium]|nr:hypothetical protein [Gammaproteobacteria bacterium]
MAPHKATICSSRTGLSALLSAILLCLPATLPASQSGIPGYSQSSSGSTSCHDCHTYSSSAPYNTLSISGSSSVLAGSTSSFSVLLSADDNQNMSYGGIDLSTSAGLLMATDSATTITSSELVHSSPKALTDTGSSLDASWAFDWQAPASAGTVTLSACGLPVNGDGSAVRLGEHGSRDGRVACNTFDILVQQKPVAVAGDNQTVKDTDASVSLDGSQSNDPDGSISTYLWEQVSGNQLISIINADSANAGFAPPDVAPGSPEEYVFRLTVTDNDNLSSSDTLSIFVQDPLDTNVAPTANAGTDQSVGEKDAVTQLPAVVNLDGSASNDPDGSINSYLWEQTSGTNTVSINNASSAMASFTAPAVDSAGDSLTFRLTVTDDLGVAATDSVTITINDVDTPPTAKITDASGVVISAINNNASVTLYGNFSSDPEGPITAYSWAQSAGLPIINPGPANENSFSFTAPDDEGGSITIDLTVTGDEGSATDTISAVLQLSNLPPEVTAGPDQTISEGETISLYGTVSDPNNDLATVQWRQINCTDDCLLPPTTINLPLPSGDAHASVLSPAVSAGDSVVLSFELNATDSKGLSRSATTTVTINDNGIDGFPDDAIPFTSYNGRPMAISVETVDSSNNAVISELLTADNTSISDNNNRPLSFPYELVDLQIRLDTPGSVMVTLYFPEPVPEAYDFYQYMSSVSWVSTTKAKNFDDLNYDAAKGWREIAEEAEFSADRRSVSFLLTDGGPSDTDPATGIISIATALGQNPPQALEQPGATGALSLPVLMLGLLLVGIRHIVGFTPATAGLYAGLRLKRAESIQRQ